MSHLHSIDPKSGYGAILSKSGYRFYDQSLRQFKSFLDKLRDSKENYTQNIVQFRILSIIKIIILPWLLLSLSACATVTRGSHTQFVVQTIPAGAAVTTDLQRSRANGGQVEYFACSPTPCSITLPRRSDFNVMITLPEHQPFTYAITKEYNKQAIKNNTKAAVATGSVVAGGVSLFAGGVSATTAAALPGAFTAAVAVQSVIIAVPAIGVGTGVDMMSGSLIDLYPNPLNVQFAVDTDPKQSEELVTMFLKSRKRRQEEAEK